MHLHENARKALARHFVSAVSASNSGLRCVIETHSRTFLLGIQLAVASGELAADDVVIYWLDRQKNGASVPIAIRLDDSGRPDSPVLQTVLSEDERLIDELLEYQLAEQT